MINYKENLKRLLSYYPYIYLDDKQVNNIDNNKFTHFSDFFYIKSDIRNVFITYENYLKDYITIDISLGELQCHIDQLERDKRLKEIIQIINE